MASRPHYPGAGNPFADPNPYSSPENETTTVSSYLPRYESVDTQDLHRYVDKQAKLPEHSILTTGDSRAYETAIPEDDSIGRNMRGLTLKGKIETEEKPSRGERRRGSIVSTDGSSSMNDKFNAEQNLQFAIAVEEWLAAKEGNGTTDSIMQNKEKQKEEDMSIEEEMLEFQYEEAQSCMNEGDWEGAEEVIASIFDNTAIKPDDRRLTFCFIKLLDIHIMQGNWAAILRWTDKFDRDGPESGPVNLLTASAYWFMSKPLLARHFCQQAVERSRKNAKYQNTSNEAMGLMAELMDAEGKKVEAKFYRSKLPGKYQAAFERKRLQVEGRVIKKEYTVSPASEKSNTLMNRVPQRLNKHTDIQGDDDDDVVEIERGPPENPQEWTTVSCPQHPGATPSIHSIGDLPFPRPDQSSQFTTHRSMSDSKGIPSSMSLKLPADRSSTAPVSSTVANPTFATTTPEVVASRFYNIADRISQKDMIMGKDPELRLPAPLFGETTDPAKVFATRPVYFDDTGRLKAKDYNIVAAFSHAMKKDKRAMANMLFSDPLFPKNEADKIMTYTGLTPLHFAAKHNRYYYVHALILRGEEVDARSTTGKTAMSYAVEHNSLNYIRALKEEGANLSLTYLAGQWEGYLHRAVNNNQPETVGLLLELGAPDDRKDTSGRTAYQIAEERPTKYAKVIDKFQNHHRRKVEPSTVPPAYTE